MSDVEQLYREHGPALLAYLRRAFVGADSAEDLLHETFLRAMRQGDRLAEAVSPRAWLFTIARNVAISALRRRRCVPLTVEVAADAGPAEPPELERMRRAIADLPAEQRETLELRLREELSYEEIASVLGVPLGTVRSRLHLAVRRLRERLTGPPDDRPARTDSKG